MRQVDSELGKKANQFNKTTKAILQLVTREFDSPHLFEAILTDLTPPALEGPEEPEEPSDSDSKAKLIKWEIKMNKCSTELANYHGGLFSLRALINGQG